MDGLGAQARQARGRSTPRSAASRRDFDTVVGAVERLQDVKYVIALDSDTQLPRDAARQLAGTMAHPLNRPVYDEKRGRVTEGYASCSRASASPWRARRGRASRACSPASPGIDPYTRAVSDVYQDVFDEGSFVGKGIYDVDALRRALGGRLPENRILSHDLLEGAYARAGLVSDVVLFEDYPLDVRRRRQPALALDPRRLADRAVAAVAACPAATARRRREPDLGAVAVEDPRQPAPQPGADRAAGAARSSAGRLPGAARSRDRWWSSRILVLPGLLAAAAELARRPGELPRRPARPRDRARARAPARCARLRARLPAVRRLHQPRRDRAHRRARSRHAAPAPRVADRERRPAQRAPPASPASYAVDVDRAGRRGGRCDAGSRCAIRSRCPWPAPVIALWVLAPALVVVAEPADPSRAAPVCLAEDRGLPAHGRAADVALLRDLRGAGRQLSAARQLPGGSAAGDRAPHVADEHRPVAAGEPGRVRLRLRLGGRADRANDADVRARWTGCSGIAATSTTGTTRARSSRCARCTSRRSTAATSPGHLITLAAGLDELEEQTIFRAEQVFVGLRGTLDVIAEMAEPGAASADLRRTLARLRQPARYGCRDPVRLAACSWRALLRRSAASSSAWSIAAPDDETSWWVDAFAAQCRRCARASWTQPGALGRARRPPCRDAARDGLTAATLATRWPRLELRSFAATCEVDAARRPSSLAAGRAAERLVRARGGWRSSCGELADDGLRVPLRPSRHLLSIGYNVGDHRLDASFYDLLASEARLASFVAIAQGKLPQEHWFSLGRLLTTSGGRPALLSWSGSMFEYLMPLLVMPTYERTLLDETYRAVVERQIEYGRERERAVGRLGVGLQQDRRAAQLSVPRVRRARARASSAASPTIWSSRPTRARWR